MQCCSILAYAGASHGACASRSVRTAVRCCTICSCACRSPACAPRLFAAVSLPGYAAFSAPRARVPIAPAPIVCLSAAVSLPRCRSFSRTCARVPIAPAPIVSLLPSASPAVAVFAHLCTRPHRPCTHSLSAAVSLPRCRSFSRTCARVPIAPAPIVSLLPSASPAVAVFPYLCMRPHCPCT